MGGARGLFRTTAFRWTLAIAAGFTGMALLLFGFIYWQTAFHERERIDGLLVRETQRLAALAPAEVGPALDKWVEADLHAVRYAGLFAADGKHLNGNLLSPTEGLSEDGRAHRAVFVGIDRDRDGDSPEVVQAVARRTDDGRLMVLGYDIDELEDVQDIVLRALGLGLVPTIVLSGAGGMLFARRAQRRIATIHESVGRIMKGKLGERLPVRGSGDDLDRLASAVNGMLGEIERLVAEIRAVGDNIAHDLRTPLTRVRARLERGREDSRSLEACQACIDRSLASVDQALAVVSAVLRIGEMEHGRRRSGFGPIDLAEVARNAFELYEPLAEEKAMELRLRIGSDALVFGDRDLLLEAVGNLLDNALKFAPLGTEVTLSVSSDHLSVRLAVADRGPGIPPEERKRVLGRFYRLEKSRTLEGTGLGLSLVEAIASLHGFTLEIGDANPGCIVRIVAPPLGDVDGGSGPGTGETRSTADVG